MTSGPLRNSNLSKRKRKDDTSDLCSSKVPCVRPGRSHSTAGRRSVALKVVTDSVALQQMHRDEPTQDENSRSHIESDTDSLFGDAASPSSTEDYTSINTDYVPTTHAPSDALDTTVDQVSTLYPARRAAPPIPGLYFDSTLRLPTEFAEDVMWTCIRTYFQSNSADQVMLFERASPSSSSCLPPVLTALLSTLSTLLRPLLPPEKHALLFPTGPTPSARQAILNLYWPGDGITPHVDLLDRYGDGIIGVSLGSGCVMQFAKVRKGRGDEPASERVEELQRVEGESGEHYTVYLPPGSVIVLTEEARYTWMHGIAERMDDLVECDDSCADHKPSDCTWLSRGVRLSVTYRWLLPGADVVGSVARDSTA